MTMDRVVALQSRAWRLQDDGDFDAASQALGEAIAAARECATPLDVANLLADSAEVEYERGAYLMSLQHARRALAVIDESRQDAAHEAAARIRLRALDRCGAAQCAVGRYAESESTLREAVGLAAAHFGVDTFESAQVRNALGIVYKFWGRWDEALAVYEDVLRIVVAISGETSEAAAAVYHNIGGLLHAQGECARAEAPARRAWDIVRAARGDDHPDTMLHAAAYASVLDGLGRHDESRPLYDRALAVVERRFGSEHPETAAVLHNRAAACAAGGEHDAAERDYRRALAIKERTIGRDAPDTALTRQNLGRLLCETGRSNEGIPLLRSALDALAARLPADHPYVIAAHANLARAGPPT
jgi:tetratricopeptide (TPR) repeat protein